MNDPAVRFLVVVVFLLAGCETTRQAKIAAVSAAGVALVGGYLEHKVRSDGVAFQESLPISFIIGGGVALASFVSIFVLDDVPRIRGSDEHWRPSTYRAGSELLAAIQRTACLDHPCPVYNLAIYRDGTVVFHGHADVSVCGEAIGKLSAEQVHELERQLTDAGVSAMELAYDRWDLRHAPSAYLWFRPSGGHTKAITHYLGDRNAPEALFRAEIAVDTAANVKQWTGEHPGSNFRTVQRFAQHC